MGDRKAYRVALATTGLLTALVALLALPTLLVDGGTSVAGVTAPSFAAPPSVVVVPDRPRAAAARPQNPGRRDPAVRREPGDARERRPQRNLLRLQPGRRAVRARCAPGLLPQPLRRLRPRPHRRRSRRPQPAPQPTPQPTPQPEPPTVSLAVARRRQPPPPRHLPQPKANNGKGKAKGHAKQAAKAAAAAAAPSAPTPPKSHGKPVAKAPAPAAAPPQPTAPAPEAQQPASTEPPGQANKARQGQEGQEQVGRCTSGSEQSSRSA